MTIATLDELQTRARFVRDIASNRCVYVVDGIDGFARVTSQRGHGHAVELLWTDPSEAARWADVLVAEPKITALSIETLLSRHLPKLAEESRLIGANWSDAPAEPEMTAKELDTQVRRYLMENFIEQVAKNRHVWVLKGGRHIRHSDHTASGRRGSIAGVCRPRQRRARDGRCVGADHTRALANG